VAGGEADVQIVAVCDVRRERRDLGKAVVDEKYGNRDCATSATSEISWRKSRNWTRC
jgi:hypothetical protein